MRSATRRKIEEEFMEGTEGESRMVLQTNSTIRCRVMGVGIVWSRGRHHVFEMPKMWQRGVLCERRSETRSDPLLEKREDKLVQMQSEENGADVRAHLVRRQSHCNMIKQAS